MNAEYNYDELLKHFGSEYKFRRAIARYMTLGEEPTLPEGLQWSNVAIFFHVRQDTANILCAADLKARGIEW